MTIKVAEQKLPRYSPPFVIYRVFGTFVQSLFPFSLIKRRNPWFDYLVQRHYRRSRRFPKRIKRYTLIWGCIVPFAIAVLGCLIAVVARTKYEVLHLSDWAELLMVVGFLGSLGISILCDMYYAVVTVGRVNLDFYSIHSDLLRITLLPERDIVAGSYAALQLRLWRPAVFEMAIRALTLFVVELSVVIESYRYRTYSDPHISFDPYMFYLLAIITAFAIPFVLEPLWRLRTVIGLGFVTAMHISARTSAYLTVFLGLLGMLIARAIIIVGVIWLFNAVFRTFYRWDETINTIILLSGIVTGAAMFYLFYRFVQAASIRFAVSKLCRGM